MESINAPQHVIDWIESRTLSFHTLLEWQVFWKFSEIEIPIFSPSGDFLFNKYRRDPASNTEPKYRYEKGATAALYGANKMNDKHIIICEGELDMLALRSHGFTAVSSTGGAGTFLNEWAPLFSEKETIIMYDNDKAGVRGALHVQSIVPHARIAELPDFSGIKDITDYCMYVKKDGLDIPNALQGWFDAAQRYNMQEFDLPKTLSGRMEIIDKYNSRIAWAYERRGQRTRRFLTTMLLDTYITYHQSLIQQIKKEMSRKVATPLDGSLIARAKAVPMTEYLKFTRDGFAECPFHSEKSASFHYMKHSNKGHCFGCNKTADVIEVVAQLNNLKYMEAARYICR